MKNPRETIAHVAATQVGVRETDGQNRGAGIEKYWAATDYPDGYAHREPYCAAFVSWCVREADRLRPEIALPKVGFAAVRRWLGWAGSPGSGCLLLPPCAICTPDTLLPEKGDLWVMLPSLSHIAVVEHCERNKGTVWLHTIEGNTSTRGVREGEGVMRQVRCFDHGSAIRLPCRALAPR